MLRTREDVLAMHKEYEAGQTLEEVGRAHGLTRERVRQLFDEAGLPRRTAAETVAMKTADISDEQVIDLYMQHGSVDKVLEYVPMSRALVSEIVASIPDREAYQGRRTDRLYDEEDFIRALRRAAEVKGEPLTMPAYRMVAEDEGMPSLGTLLAYFKDHDQPWQTALAKARVKGNPSRRQSTIQYPADQCVAAVKTYIERTGERSYQGYLDWRPKNHPSGPTIRARVGWAKAVKLALDTMADRAI